MPERTCSARHGGEGLRREGTRCDAVTVRETLLLGGFMKRKGNRDIPDFSKRRPPVPGTPEATQKAPAPPQPVRGKPQSKSAKSGQRGR